MNCLVVIDIEFALADAAREDDRNEKQDRKGEKSPQASSPGNERADFSGCFCFILGCFGNVKIRWDHVLFILTLLSELFVLWPERSRGDLT